MSLLRSVMIIMTIMKRLQSYVAPGLVQIRKKPVLLTEVLTVQLKRKSMYRLASGTFDDIGLATNVWDKRATQTDECEEIARTIEQLRSNIHSVVTRIGGFSTVSSQHCT